MFSPIKMPRTLIKCCLALLGLLTAGRRRWTRVSFQAPDPSTCPLQAKSDAHTGPQEPSGGE